MPAVVWGTKDWNGFTTGKGSSIGTLNTIWAYIERVTWALQAGVKEVFDGDGVVRYRRNWGNKYRVDFTAVPVDAAATLALRNRILLDDPILIDDDIYGTTYVFVDNDTKERVAGEAGPGAERLHITGWAYPALVHDGLP